jgi:hypothetical protein
MGGGNREGNLFFGSPWSMINLKIVNPLNHRHGTTIFVSYSTQLCLRLNFLCLSKFHYKNAPVFGKWELFSLR